MRLTTPLLLIVSCLLAIPPARCDPARDPALEVREAEAAFAKTMADRDLEAFLGFKALKAANSVWRRDAKGRWKLVFDKGCPPRDRAREPIDGGGSP